MGFLSNMLGTENKYQADLASLNMPDYNTALRNTMEGSPANINWGESNAIGGQQSELARALAAQAAGYGPNIAQDQFKQATGQIAGQQAGAIASQKGINPALAARTIGEAGTNQMQQAAGQSGVMRSQQQLAAQQLLAQALVQQRQQSAQQAVGDYGANSQRVATLGGLIGQQNNANLSNKLGTNQINASVAAGNQGANTQVAGAGIKAWGDMSSAFMSSMGGMGAAEGGMVEGQPEVAGDSPKNDTVHAMLSPGEIVIPRTIANDPDKAKDFVAAIIKMNKKKKAGSGSYGKVIAAKSLTKKGE